MYITLIKNNLHSTTTTKIKSPAQISYKNRIRKENITRKQKKDLPQFNFVQLILFVHTQNMLTKLIDNNKDGTQW